MIRLGIGSLVALSMAAWAALSPLLLTALGPVGSLWTRCGVAALVLFMLTFMFNTLAEVVRQRLRNQYGSL